MGYHGIFNFQRGSNFISLENVLFYLPKVMFLSHIYVASVASVYLGFLCIFKELKLKREWKNTFLESGG